MVKIHQNPSKGITCLVLVILSVEIEIGDRNLVLPQYEEVRLLLILHAAHLSKIRQ